jgi:5,10-methylenetetrahydromethanopterin reductase
MTFRLGVGVLQAFPPSELIELVREIEALGYDDLWYSNEKFYRDPWIGLTIAALYSTRLRLGTFIADPYTQHPALIAVSIASLAELAPGRTVLLMGAGGAAATPLGFGRRKPARAIEEAIHVVRRLLHGERVNFEGEIVRFLGGRLSFEPRRDIPIYVASRGDLVLEMAGKFADGAMIATYSKPRGIQHGLERIRLGAEEAGRTLDDLEVLSRVDVCIHEDRRVAIDAVKPMVARMIGSSYPDKRFVQQMGLNVPAELESVLGQKNPELTTRSAYLLPDEFVTSFAWAGTAEDVARQVAAVVKTGVNAVAFLPHAPADTDPRDIMPTIRTFALEVRPLVGEMLKD